MVPPQDAPAETDKCYEPSPRLFSPSDPGLTPPAARSPLHPNGHRGAASSKEVIITERKEIARQPMEGGPRMRSWLSQVSSSTGTMPTLKGLLLLLFLSVLSSPVWAYGGISFLSNQLSCGDKQLIVSMHNQMRQRVANGQVPGQPPAANMREMVWDEELAQIAQNWASQGRIVHNSPRSGRFRVGENIAATWTYGHPSPSGSGPDFRKCISDWFAEVSYFPSSSVRSYQFSHSTGHYSQLVWADTYLVGCGYSYYLDPQKGYTKFYVCNYGPAGNIIGGQLYQSGPPSCASYGLYPSRTYSGLCEVPGSNPPGPVCSASSPYSAPLQQYYSRPYYYGR